MVFKNEYASNWMNVLNWVIQINESRSEGTDAASGLASRFKGTSLKTQLSQPIANASFAFIVGLIRKIVNIRDYMKNWPSLKSRSLLLLIWSTFCCYCLTEDRANEWAPSLRFVSFTSAKWRPVHIYPDENNELIKSVSA